MVGSRARQSVEEGSGPGFDPVMIRLHSSVDCTVLDTVPRLRSATIMSVLSVRKFQMNLNFLLIITRFCGNLPHYQIAPSVLCIVAVLANRVLSDKSVNRSCLRRRNYPYKLVMFCHSCFCVRVVSQMF